MKVVIVLSALKKILVWEDTDAIGVVPIGEEECIDFN